MKKFLALLFSALILMSVSVTAFADMEGPSFVEYEVIVSNSKGIKVKNGDGEVTIPYNQKLKVVYEYVDEEILGIVYKDKHYEISPKDVAKVVAKVDKEEYKLSKTYELVTINPNGVELRDGPGESYEVVGKIPYGKVVKSNYGIGFYGKEDDEYGLSWIYVSYDNYSGWMNCAEFAHEGRDFNCATVAPKSNKNYVELISEEYYLFDSPEGIKKVSDVIPAGTKLFYNYFYRVAHGFYYYVNYNGVDGWIYSRNEEDNSFSCVEPKDIGVYTRTEVELYKSPKHGNDFEVIGTIPADKMLASTKYAMETISYYYDYRDWFYVNYEGNSGWICSNVENEWKDHDAIILYDCEEVELFKSVQLLSKPDSNSQVLSTIPQGTKMECLINNSMDGDSLGFVKYNGQYGWVLLNGENCEQGYDGTRNFTEFYTGKLDSVVENQSTDSTPSTAPSFENAEEAVANEPGKGEATENTKTKTIVIICVVAAVVLASTGIVLIVFLKKRKQAKA